MWRAFTELRLFAGAGLAAGMGGMTEPVMWYQLSSYSSHIEPVQVVSETKETVNIRELWHGTWGPARRRYKEGEFFPTFELAKKALIERAEDKVRSAQFSLDRANNDLRVAKELQP